MTTPSSPVDIIAKAMEGEFRRAAVNLVDTLVLERETNGQSKEFMDWAVFMTARSFEKQLSFIALKLRVNEQLAIANGERAKEEYQRAESLARQAEAMKREMAEKDARIAALEDGLRPFAAFRTPDHPGRYSDAISEHFSRFEFETARALIGGGNAEV